MCQTSASHPGRWRLNAHNYLAAQSWKCYTPSRSCHQNAPPPPYVPNQCEPSGSVAIACTSLLGSPELEVLYTVQVVPSKCATPPPSCQTSASHPGLWRLQTRHHLAAQSWRCYTPSRSCHQNAPRPHLVPNQCEPSGSVAIARTSSFGSPELEVLYTVQVVPSKCATPPPMCQTSASHPGLWRLQAHHHLAAQSWKCYTPSRSCHQNVPPPHMCQTSASHPGLWRLHTHHHLAAQSWRCYTLSSSCHQNAPPHPNVPNQCEPSGSLAMAYTYYLAAQSWRCYTPSRCYSTPIGRIALASPPYPSAG